jgi:hypothetical protein
MNLLDFIAVTLPEHSSFTWGDVALLGVVFTMINALIKIGDRLWSKGQAERSVDETNAQNIVCREQHHQLTESMRNLGAQMEKQSEIITRLVTVIREQAHAEEVRSQAVSMRLDLVAATQNSMLNGQQEMRRDLADLRT